MCLTCDRSVALFWRGGVLAVADSQLANAHLEAAWEAAPGEASPAASLAHAAMPSLGIWQYQKTVL